MSHSPEDFDHAFEPNGHSTITRHGRKATTLRGAKAEKFLSELELDGPRELMAPLAGNCRRGNGRAAGKHPRNAGNRRRFNQKVDVRRRTRPYAGNKGPTRGPAAKESS